MRDRENEGEGKEIDGERERERERTSPSAHLENVLFKTCSLARMGAKTVAVIDGPPHPKKRSRHGKSGRNRGSLLQQYVRSVRPLLEAMGVPVATAEH